MSFLCWGPFLPKKTQPKPKERDTPFVHWFDWCTILSSTHTRRAKVKHLMHQIYDICQIFSSTQPDCVITFNQIDKGSCYQKHFLSSEVSTFQVNSMQNKKVEGSILGMKFQKKFLKWYKYPMTHSSLSIPISVGSNFKY